MTPMIIELVAFLVFSLSAWYFLYCVIPKFGKWTTLCLLHNIRDQIYDIQMESQVGEDSLLYKDMLFSLTLLIHLIRDKSQRVTIPIINSVLWSKSEEEPDWRDKRHNFERKTFFSNDVGHAELNTALKLYYEKDFVLCFYLVTSRPMLIIVICAVTLFIAPLYFARDLWLRSRNKTDVRSVGKTLDSFRPYQDKDQMGGLQGQAI